MSNLAIIIPAYNAEAYICNALDSIFQQEPSNNNYRVIVVNDGSNDKTVDIVLDYQKNYPNLTLISQVNCGVSVARNNALNVVIEDYVTFLDADDRFAPGALVKILETIDKFKSQILIFKSFNDTFCTERYKWSNVVKENQDYSFKDLFALKYTRGSVCGGIYSTSFLKTYNIKFPEGVAYGEDSIFFTQCLSYVSKMTFHDIDFYRITTRENSALTTYDRSKIVKFRKGVEYIRQNLLCDKNSKLQIAIYNHLIYRIISRCIHDACLIDDISPIEIMRIDWIRNNLPIKSANIYSQRGGIFMINHSYPLYCLIAYVKNKIRKSK